MASLIRRMFLVVVPVGLLLAILVPVMTPKLGQRDFIGYWSSTHLLLTGKNPYNSAALHDLQMAIDPELIPVGSIAVESWNPPWLMLLLIPWGALPFNIAALLWIVSNVFLVGIVAWLTWKLFAHPGQEHWFTFALAGCFLFGPALNVLQIGQISILLILALLVAVHLLRSGKDELAGAVLLFPTVKPHIVYLVGLILLIWIIRNRRWRVFAGFLAAAALTAVGVWIIRPDWWQNYPQMVSKLPYMGLYTSTLGSFMSQRFGMEIFRFSAVLLLPLLPFLARRFETDPITSLNLALLLSVPLSPYGFSFDQVVLLPAVIQLLTWVWQSPVNWKIGLGLAAVYGANLWMLSVRGLSYDWFVLIPLALAGLYLWAWRNRANERIINPA